MSEVDQGRSAIVTPDDVTRLAPARVVAVLGMHRSGTSCLTGSLQQHGLFLGEHHTRNRHNQKGNRENQGIVDLHQAILEENGGDWDRPPRKVKWSEGRRADARNLLFKYRDAPVFGFKDPRALLTIIGWKELYPGLECVGIFRHPSAVFASLHKRNSKTWEECMNLWYVYNKALYREYKDRQFPIIDFGLEEAQFDEKVAKLVEYLGLDKERQGGKFYAPRLKHNSESDDCKLPWKVRRLYSRLKKASF